MEEKKKIDCKNKKSFELNEKASFATCVRHAQPSASVVLQLEILILEALSVDRASACAIALCKIASYGKKFLFVCLLFN